MRRTVRINVDKLAFAKWNDLLHVSWLRGRNVRMRMQEGCNLQELRHAIRL